MASSISRLAVACALATACATPTSSPRAGAVPAPIGRSTAAIGLGELTGIQPDLDVYQAVERLRPQFLHVRPGTHVLRGTAPRIRVYINGNFAGDVTTLRSLRVRDVASLRRLQPSESHLLPGGGAGAENEGGAILVTLFQ